MPKDAKKNIDRYKVRGGELNEFDFHQNQEGYAEQLATKGTKSTKKKNAPTGASAKKLAARKAAKRTKS